MNTLVTFEIARHEQDARVRHAMHVRALKSYRRDHPVRAHRRQRFAALLHRCAAWIDDHPAAAPETCSAPGDAGSGRRLSTR